MAQTPLIQDVVVNMRRTEPPIFAPLGPVNERNAYELLNFGAATTSNPPGDMFSNYAAYADHVQYEMERRRVLRSVIREKRKQLVGDGHSYTTHLLALREKAYKKHADRLRSFRASKLFAERQELSRLVANRLLHAAHN
jgi:hypothetical protein